MCRRQRGLARVEIVDCEVPVWIDDNRLTTLGLRENCMRQPFFHNQSEPEPMADLREQIRDNDRFARAGHSEQDAVLRSVSQPRVAAVKLPELAQRHGNPRFEESLGEGYIRLVARLAQSIALQNRSLPLAFLLKRDKNREN